MLITKQQKEFFRKAVGKILEKRRVEKGISRKDLGVALGYEGNSAVQVVARFEAGRSGVPKAKIEKLLEILDISNKDFGLVASQSLKNFIAASGFLNSPVAPWSNAMVSLMETHEANFMKEALTDEENSDEPPADDTYQDVIRIMRLYRVQKKEAPLTVFDRLDLLDTLSEGDEDKLAEMLLILKIDPAEAYREIEGHLMERLKGVKD